MLRHELIDATLQVADVEATADGGTVRRAAEGLSPRGRGNR